MTYLIYLFDDLDDLEHDLEHDLSDLSVRRVEYCSNSSNSSNSSSSSNNRGRRERLDRRFWRRDNPALFVLLHIYIRVYKFPLRDVCDVKPRG